jgi:tRNA G18 (ribose-2'-O)-methylase SpoU
VLSVPTAGVTREELLEIATREALALVVADASGDPGEPPPSEAILLFGNEGAGVSPELARAARAISIETTGRVESLNVASAAAILLARSYQLRHATGPKGGSRR